MIEKQFDFFQNYELENDAVLLRPLTAADHEHLVEYVLQEPDLWQYSLVQPIGEEGLNKYIQTALKARQDGKEYPFIMYDKRSKKYAGSTRFYDIQMENKTLQLGYTWYGKSFQGTGLNKNCKFLLLQFAFEKMGMERVEFRADNNNKKSIAAMKSIGCTVEGVLRQNMLLQDGRRRDSIILSILKEEWKAALKEQLMLKIKSGADKNR
jgi:RimJ/RimL family protein N-acetyltransferase